MLLHMDTTTATPRQVTFINDLVKQREVPADLKASLDAAFPTLTKRAASQYIGALLLLAKVKAPAAPVAAAAPVRIDPRDLVSKALTEVPTGRYALEGALLDILFKTEKTRGEIYFVEVKELSRRDKRKGIFRIAGAPGYFNRFRIATTDDQIIAASEVSTHLLEAAKRFADHYSCCARCAAPLTDDRSRELGLGPTCRKYFGIK